MKFCCCWLYAISKYGYPPSIRNTFRAIDDMVKLGFDAVEIEAVGHENLMSLHKRKEKLLEFCENRGTKIANLCAVFRDIISPDVGARQQALEDFSTAASLAKFLGAETLQTDTFTPPIAFVGETPYKKKISFGERVKVKIDPRFSWEEFWTDLVSSMKECDRIAKEHSLKFCIEPRVGESIANTDAMLRLMEHVKSENFGVVLDTAHLHAQKEILPLSVEKLGSKIFYVHASDNDGRDNYHLRPGLGTIDWEGVFKALRRSGFDGYVGLDMGNILNLDSEIAEGRKFLDRLARELNL